MWNKSHLSFFLIDWCTTQTITVLVKAEFLLWALHCRIRYVFIDLDLSCADYPFCSSTINAHHNTHLVLELLPRPDLVSISWYHLIYLNAAESPGLLINLDTCYSCLAYALKGHWLKECMWSVRCLILRENLSCFIYDQIDKCVCLWHFLSQCYDNDSWEQQFAGNHDASANV